MESEPESTASAGDRFLEPRRLHPVSIILGINIVELAQGLLLPVIALAGSARRWILPALVLVVVVGAVGRVLDWLRRSYTFTGSELRVESGIFGREVRSLDVARIQQIEIRRSLLQRLAGVARVRVETAGSASEPEVELKVIPEADAVALRSEVRRAKARALGQVAAPEGNEEVAGVAAASGPRPILTVPAWHVALSAITGARLVVLPAFLAAGLQLGGDLSETVVRALGRRIERAVEPLVAGGGEWLWIGALALGFVLLTMIGAAIVGLLRDGRFRIEEVDGDLQVTRGLLTTNEAVIPVARVQLVRLRSNWVRRLLGFGVVEIRSAGGSANAAGSVSIPLLAVSDFERVLGELLPESGALPELRAHPSAALRRCIARRSLRATLLAAALAAVAARFGWLSGGAGLLLVGLVVLGVVRGVAEYRALAHAIDDAVVVSRGGALSITTEVAPLAKVQAVSGRSDPFQRRLDLASLDVHVAGPADRLRVRDAGRERVAELHAALTERASGC